MKYFLQSPEWESFQRSLGRTVHRRQGSGWSFLAIEEANPAGKVLYTPYGPLADNVDAFDAALAELVKLAQECGAVFVRLEPVDAGLGSDAAGLSAMRARGLEPAPANQQPELSWIIDLDQTDKEILADMKSANRNLYRNIHKKGVSFRQSTDPAEISILLEFLHQTATRNGFKPQSDEYLTAVAKSLMPAGAATLFIAELEGLPIGAALAYDSADTRVYAHAAVDPEHRKLSAGVPLLVGLILDAKAKGLSFVDLWGVAPADQPNHKWAGFTAFKKSFGGHQVAYLGTWDLPVNKIRYRLYHAARGARTVLRTGLGRVRSLTKKLR
ncbi:lipid II:glycine glycyltransferase FemX [Pseudarthrobacter sp. J1738]|uniref:lipid II:glycine glycyltransferase FemX n=1 Tax=Pseudarthrobacter sp. J1738 TaxID=3420446 RepID=UPI003D2A8422